MFFFVRVRVRVCSCVCLLFLIVFFLMSCFLPVLSLSRWSWLCVCLWFFFFNSGVCVFVILFNWLCVQSLELEKISSRSPIIWRFVFGYLPFFPSFAVCVVAMFSVCAFCVVSVESRLSHFTWWSDKRKIHSFLFAIVVRLLFLSLADRCFSPFSPIHVPPCMWFVIQRFTWNRKKTIFICALEHEYCSTRNHVLCSLSLVGEHINILLYACCSCSFSLSLFFSYRILCRSGHGLFSQCACFFVYPNTILWFT